MITFYRICITICFLCITTQSISQTSFTFEWDFTTISPIIPTTGNVSVSDIRRGNNWGNNQLLVSTSSSAGNYPDASGGNNAGATARTGILDMDQSVYFEFTITPASGYKIKLTQVNFGSRSTTTGPSKYTIRTDTDNFEADINSANTIIADGKWRYLNNPVDLSGKSCKSVVVRIYGYNGTGSATSGSANWRIDDLSVGILLEETETVTPSVSIVSTHGTTICEGTPVTLIATAFNEGNIPSYKWYKNNQLVNQTTENSYTAIPLSSGDTYKCELVSNHACADPQTAFSNELVFAINTLPAPLPLITGDIILCNPGESTQLSIAATNGIWSSSDSNIALVDVNGLVSAKATGVTRIIYSTQNSCGTRTTNANIHVYNTSTGEIIGKDTIVVDSSSLLICSPAGGIWSSDNPSIVSIDNQGWIKGITEGKATISYSITNGHCHNSSSLQITVIPPPPSQCGIPVWTFTDSTSNPYLKNEITNTQSVSEIKQGNNNGTTTMLSRTTPSSGYASASGSFNACAAAIPGDFNNDNSTYFEFVITPEKGYTIEISSLNFGSRSTSTGPIKYAIRTSIDNFSEDLNTVNALNINRWDLYSNSFNIQSKNNDPVVIRIYGYGGSNGASKNIANWRIDDIYVKFCTDKAPLPEIKLSIEANKELNICTGTPVIFRPVMQNAGRSPVLQWKKNKENVFTGYEYRDESLKDNDTISCVMSGEDDFGNTYNNLFSNELAIRVFPQIPLPTITGDTVICVGRTTQLSNLSSGGGWSVSNQDIAAITQSGEVTGLNKGKTIITYTTTNTYGCIDSTSQLIHIVATATPTLSGPEKNTYCNGETASLQASGIEDATSLIWYVNDFRINNETKATLKTTVGGNYFIQSVNKYGCISGNSNAVEITFVPLPTLSILPKDTAILKGSSFTARVSSDGNNIEWSPNSGISTIESFTPVFSPAFNTQYTATVTNDKGCSTNATINIEVIVNASNRYNNLLTPDGDGINDQLVINGFENETNTKLQVFDKSGKLVYQKENYRNDWRGKVNGRTLRNDTYYFIFSVNNEIKIKGSVTIINPY